MTEIQQLLEVHGGDIAASTPCSSRSWRFEHEVHPALRAGTTSRLVHRAEDGPFVDQHGSHRPAPRPGTLVLENPAATGRRGAFGEFIPESSSFQELALADVEAYALRAAEKNRVLAAALDAVEAEARRRGLDLDCHSWGELAATVTP